MKRRVACLTTLAMLVSAVPAQAQDSGQQRRDARGAMPFASPGKVVAAEIALAQLARRKGQWKAFRETAAEGAVMFVPQPVDARQWLGNQPESAAPMGWEPHAVFLSCDGSLAVASGPWRKADGASGGFTTVWQRQKRGEYKWVMSQADDLAASLGAPDMIRSSVATCQRGARKPVATPVTFPAGTRGGWSEDGTLSWEVRLAADCSRTLTVSLGRGAGKPMEPVLERRVAAPAVPATCTAAAA